MAGPGDNAATARSRATRSRGDGRFRVSQGDREQVIELLTADMPAGQNVSQPPARNTAKEGTAKVRTARVRAAGVGVTGAVAVAVTVVLVLITSIPPLFLVIVSCYFTAMIVAGAWVLSSRYGKHAG